jgi:trk system potassium uptake protein
MICTIILVKQARREFARIFHPRIVNPVRVAGQVVADNVVVAMLAFLLIYGGALIGSTLLLMASGLDPISSFTAVVASLSNTGPGLNQVGPATNYAGLTDFETWVCTFAMLIGRLELMSVPVRFTSTFWRK